MQPAFDSTGFTESLPRKCDCFLPDRIFVVSLRLPQRHDKLSFPLLCFLFFFFSLKKASARFSKCASRDPGTRCGRTRPDCSFAIDACQITCKALPVNFQSRWRESLASRLGPRSQGGMGSFEVEESHCRSVTALSITQRGCFRVVEFSGPSQVLENVGLFRK